MGVLLRAQDASGKCCGFPASPHSIAAAEARRQAALLDSQCICNGCVSGAAPSRHGKIAFESKCRDECDRLALVALGAIAHQEQLVCASRIKCQLCFA